MISSSVFAQAQFSRDSKKRPNTRPIESFFVKKPVPGDGGHAEVHSQNSSGLDSSASSEVAVMVAGSGASSAHSSSAGDQLPHTIVEENVQHSTPCLQQPELSSSVQHQSSASSSSCDHSTVNPVSANLSIDIGKYVGKGKSLQDFEKCLPLEKPWTPPQGYAFPFSIHKKDNKERKRFVGHQHLQEYFWLVLSNINRGLYCKYCVLFAGEYAGRHSSTP